MRSSFKGGVPLSGGVSLDRVRTGALSTPKRAAGASAPRGRSRTTCNALFERFTERSVRVVTIASHEALSKKQAYEVGTQHFLVGLAVESEPNSYFQAAGVSLDHLRALVQARSRVPWKLLREVLEREKGTDSVSGDAAEDSGSSESEGGLSSGSSSSSTSTSRSSSSSSAGWEFSAEAKAALVKASSECRRAGFNFITPEHILLAILEMRNCEGRMLLDSLGVTVCDKLKAEAHKRLKGDHVQQQQQQQAHPPQPPKRHQWSKAEASKLKGPPRALNAFCRDLCKEVKDGKVDPVIGRDREVARTIQVLARRMKNNPVLLGEPGVGKTAIAEGLAYAIVQRRSPDGTPLPEFLHNKRIMQLDIGLLMAGSKERGELENRVSELVEEATQAGNVVLMIDELHTLVGAGDTSKSGGGGLDIANMLKPALARGEFQVMGATTVSEHRKYIESNAALERRFQPVYIDEPSEEQTLTILEGLCERYERHHHVIFSPDALIAAVKLSTKYIQDRQLPDKAIDLLDEAGSRVRIHAYSSRKSAKRTESPKLMDYLQVVDMKRDCVSEDLFEEAGILRRREVDYRVELSGPAHEGVSLPVVTSDHIGDIVSAWTGVPVERMGSDDRRKLLQLSSALRQRVIGQDDAVDCVSSALQRARCGLKSPNRPVASLLLVGPTGVGKTELVKALAETYYGTASALVRLDMSEYMERHSVSKLIGAPPGFMGYDAGGKLTEAVRRQPCSIVLFDEIEKAHPDVMNVLLQIMEDGRLTSSQGRRVSFKNTMVILTSNVGSRTIASSSSRLGSFLGKGPEEAEEAAQANQARLRRLVTEEVKEHFKPELLNRFDEQVIFNKLSRGHVRQIAGLMIRDVQKRVQDLNKGYTLRVGPALLERIIAEGYNEEYGVRPLRRTMVKYLEDPLSDVLLMRKVPKGCVLTAELDAATDKVVVHQNKELITLESGEVVITHSAGPGGFSNNVVEYSSNKPAFAHRARTSFMHAAASVMK